MKRIEYEKKEKKTYYCQNWDSGECKAPTKERSEVKRARKDCQFCLAYKRKIKQLEKQREKQEHLRQKAEFESNKPEKPKPERLKIEKIYSESEIREQERQKQRKATKAKKSKNTPKKRLKQVSSKQQSILKEYKKVCDEIDEEREPICAGCLRGDLPLSHSHRIRVSLRKDLMKDKEGIDLMCYGYSGSCHDKVESYQWDNLNNGEEIKEYVRRKEPSEYWVYFYKNKKSA